ncbi:MAG: hypothetical protein ACI9R3_004348, partial [Verrucomicrobiales bacterium]
MKFSACARFFQRVSVSSTQSAFTEKQTMEFKDNAQWQDLIEISTEVELGMWL